MWSIVVSRPHFPWLPFGPRETGPTIHPGCVRCWTSIWPARCYSQGLSPTETLCGPLVVTVLQAAWCGHVCHIPPCHTTRRRAASWLPSCHTWMMLLRLGVWQWLALVTITIRTSFLIHLVQKVCAGDWQAFNFASSTAVMLCHLFHCSVCGSVRSSFIIAR